MDILSIRQMLATITDRLLFACDDYADEISAVCHSRFLALANALNFIVYETPWPAPESEDYDA